MKEATPRWKSVAMRVDMTPIADRARDLVAQRLARVERVDRLQGRRKSHGDERGIATLLAHEVGFCGEIAVARLLGGVVRVEEGTDGDVSLRSGHKVEVKTAFRGWPYDRKWAPSALAHKSYRPKIDTVLCATAAPPTCYEEVWVVGWITPHVLAQIAERPDGTWWRFPWSAQYWRHIAELMDDELARPWLPIGAPMRRYDGDRGDLP